MSDLKYDVVWTHETEKRQTMASFPDYKTDAKVGKVDYVKNILWPHAGRLLVSCKIATTTIRVSAILLDRPALGQPFVPVTPNGDLPMGRLDVEKAWCAWLNSTPAILAFLNRRQKKLTYSSYSLDQLQSMPIPNPWELDMGPLIDAYDANCRKPLTRWRHIDKCPVRAEIDRAAAKVAGIDEERVTDWRRRIAVEPTVCGQYMKA